MPIWQNFLDRGQIRQIMMVEVSVLDGSAKLWLILDLLGLGINLKWNYKMMYWRSGSENIFVLCFEIFAKTSTKNISNI